ncbi:bis(5'-nucleosyl)-tetraphosphatase (symmetrical) YqeK [Enorma phocaeensis]|uniref:bis(5'-nucleosyl)-tetraphosphatase (symmetrical) YqeK n=1 Tax=Enorma phocaeensis TaxID=1871019 RepID=UPI001EF3EA4D|nr:bis(5'-nucleosyl)-tetraphosphatase (symmetrical) YqeK [Enorma phocaeensis]
MAAEWNAEVTFEGDEAREIDRIKDLLAVRMKDARKRHIHSLGVASCAAALAQAYGVDPYLATVAGLIHDWDKVVPDEELVARALHYGIEISGSPALATPLLHGMVAAYELPELFPELPIEVFQAVARHTVGACDMTPLDMVVFIADAIEPGRRGDYADRLRSQVGEVSLRELFFSCFSQGLVYVLTTGRYLYPTATEIYNHYALERTNEKGHA